MATLTIDIPDSLHAQMSQVDLNWSEICRQAITAQLATKPQNTAKPEPIWRDAFIHLSPESVIKIKNYNANEEDEVIHPYLLAKKLDDVLKTNKLQLGSKAADLSQYINIQRQTFILEPYSEWRICLYKIRSTCHFIYLDDQDFYTGLWNLTISQGQSEQKFKIWFGKSIEEVPKDIQASNLADKDLKFITPRLLKSEFEFDVAVTNPEEQSEENITCKSSYKNTTSAEYISGNGTDNKGNKYHWYANRL